MLFKAPVLQNCDRLLPMAAAPAQELICRWLCKEDGLGLERACIDLDQCFLGMAFIALKFAGILKADLTNPFRSNSSLLKRVF